MKHIDVPGFLYFASVVLLGALLIWSPWPESDGTEEGERSRGSQGPNVSRSFDRKFEYCEREHGFKPGNKVFIDCLTSPLPR